MATEPDIDARVEDVLTEWFLARERGATPELAALCRGDGELERRVRRLLESEPPALRRLSSAPVAPELAPGSAQVPPVLGEFRLLRLLGSGGMASVFVAEQQGLGRQVALKVLDRSLVRDERALLRFRREAELVAAIDHPHIVPVYAVGEAQGCAYLAMKLLSGPSLDELELPLAPREAARIGLAVAEALEAAHLAGVVHRDVKPANVILDRGEPCVVDFGLARSQVDVTLTRKGAVPGTLPYLAPELLGAKQARLDPRIDVYALGATLYELIAGRLPYPEEDPERLLRRILTGDIPPLGLPPAERDLETIVLRALERDPRRRVESARALADDLGRYLERQPIVLRRTGWTTRLRERARRNRPLAVTAALALAASVALVSFLAWNALRERGRLERGLLEVRAALAQGDFSRAADLLRPLAAAHGAAPELVELTRAAGAGSAQAELMGAVLNRPVAINPAELDGLMRAVSERLADVPEPGVALAALVIGDWHLGRGAEARRRLAELEAERPSALVPALDALLADRPIPVPPVPPVPPAAPVTTDGARLSSDERVLVALLLRLTSAPLARQEAELEQALRADPSNPDARYAHAIALASAGLQQRAREVLWGLTRGAGTPREVWRNLARSLIATGDLEEAQEILGRIPRATWSPVEGYLQLELLSRRGDWAAFEARLAEFRGEIEGGAWSSGAEILRAEAEFRGHILGEVEAANALFERVQAEASDSVNRELAAASQYMLAVQRLALELPADVRGRKVLCQPLLERGSALAAELRYPRARGLVLWKLALVHLVLARNGEGFQLLEQTIELLPDHPGPRLDYAVQVDGFLSFLAQQPAPAESPEGLVRYLELCAWREACTLLEHLDRGDVTLDAGARRALLETTFALQRRMQDWAGMLALLPRLRALEPALEDAAELERLERTLTRSLRFVYGR